MKLSLGTVQFGMDYGIRGARKPSQEETFRCLDFAIQNGIVAFDTAFAYGAAEELLGEFLSLRKVERTKLLISTKLPPNLLDGWAVSDYPAVIQSALEQQLQKLHLDYVDVCLFHTAEYAFQEEMLCALARMKALGLAKKTGVSVYEPAEAIACINSPYVDFIQLPYSIFDHRMKTCGVFQASGNKKVEIHSRSAFVQGLIAMNRYEVPTFLEKAKPVLCKINNICEAEDISPIALALAYVKQEQAISHLVFGVDSLSQLQEDIALFHTDLPPDLLQEMEAEFSGIEAEIVMPSLWRKGAKNAQNA